jgi:hypothetical protein
MTVSYWSMQAVLLRELARTGATESITNQGGARLNHLWYDQFLLGGVAQMVRSPLRELQGVP